MREFTLQELDCAIKTADIKLGKLRLCCAAWEKFYGDRNIKLEELMKYTNQLLNDLNDYVTHHDDLLQAEKLQSEEADIREVYGKLNRLKKELTTISEAKEKLKGLSIYVGTQESEQNRTFRNPSEVQLFENLHRFVDQEHKDLHNQIRDISKANNAKFKALKSTTELTLSELKRTIRSYEQRLALKRIEARRYAKDFGTNNPVIEKEKSDIQQSLDNYITQLHNRKNK